MGISHILVVQHDLSDLLEGMVLCPTELIKCRLQAAKQMGQEKAGVISTVRWPHWSLLYSFTSECLCVFRNILATDGLTGLYRGLIPTWCREIPGYFCFFLGYESSKWAQIIQGEFEGGVSAQNRSFRFKLIRAKHWACIKNRMEEMYPLIACVGRASSSISFPLQTNSRPRM